jgi:hypothetical protein
VRLRGFVIADINRTDFPLPILRGDASTRAQGNPQWARFCADGWGDYFYVGHI